MNSGTSRWLGPYGVARAAIIVGVVAPAYINAKIPRIPMLLNGSLLLALVLAGCALSLVFATRPAGLRVRVAASALAFSYAWFLVALANVGASGLREMVAYAVAVTLVPLTAFLSVLIICSSTRGRLCILEGFCIGGTLAGVLGLVESIVHRNPLREFGTAMGTTFQNSISRFGVSRAEGAFSHPILLGAFLGLAMLATLELIRIRRVGLYLGLTIMAIQFIGMLATVSRGPIVAVLCVLALWGIFAASMSLRRRLLLSVPVALILAIGLSQAQVTNLGSLLQSSPGHPFGGAVNYRLTLYDAAVATLPSATAFGSPAGLSVTLAGETKSLDAEPVNLLVTRGVVGLAVFTGAIVCVIARGFTKGGRRRGSTAFTALGGLFLLLAGTSVAFFDSFYVYVFVFLGLLWAEACEHAGASGPNTSA